MTSQRTKRVSVRGYNVLITNDDGTQFWRKHIENERDPFVMAECDAGHVYVMPRDAFRWGEIPECPTCQQIIERQVA